MITWIMIFTTFYPSIGSVELTEWPGFKTQVECLQALEERVERNVGTGFQPEHMVGWCYEEAPKTLEMKPDNSKPEPLK